MRTPFAFGPRHRSGFTLVELLVVMSLIIVLSTMAILIVPGLKDKQGVSRAADQFSGWMLIAKQRAVRDQAPRGIRISQDDTGSFSVIQYIEQPDDYLPNGKLSVTPVASTVAPSPVVDNQASTRTLTADFGIDAGLIASGDSIQLTEGSFRQTYKIVSVNTASTPNSITIASNVQSAEAYRLTRNNAPTPPGLTVYNFVNTSTVKQFRIIRGMRPMSGEATQQLPVSVLFNNVNSSPAFTSTLDIAFMPSGQVKDATAGQIIFRLDPALGVSGTSTLIVIYARTGAIASHPLAEGIDPFQFVRDGQDSGL